MSADEILAPDEGKEQPKWPAEDAELTAMLEAVIYITDEPLTLEQICTRRSNNTAIASSDCSTIWWQSGRSRSTGWPSGRWRAAIR